MAWTFVTKPVATLKAKAADSNTVYSYGGINKDVDTPDNAAAQLNKILAIGGLSVVVDENLKLVNAKEAVNNG